MRTLLPLHIIHSILALAVASQSEAQEEVEASAVYEAALSRIAAATAMASSTPPTYFPELESSWPEACPNDPWHYLNESWWCSPHDELESAEVELAAEEVSSGNTTDPPSEVPFESFEDWKRRREAEALPSPPADPPPSAADNVSDIAPDPPAVNFSRDDDNSTALSSSSSPPAQSSAAARGKGHRYNYASPDCSARVLASSPQTQHASSLLHKSRDRYMLTPCRAEEHWAVVELCDEIRVEAVELAVWEFFSGIVRSVRVSVADDADGEWSVVGEFVGKNVRGAQTFTLPEPTSFHRFLRLDFPSFYGSEYYCPVSQLKVYGMNQMEAFKMEQRHAAEASGAQEEKVRAAEREAERVAEAARIAEREHKVKEDDERRQRELCELERLVQEQARRVSGHVENVFEEPLIECAPSSASSAMMAEETQPVIASNVSERAPEPATAGEQNLSQASGTAPASEPPAGTQASYRGSGRTDSSESIYAFITRRLNALEGNTTLVARYIDEQAKALRVALERAEKKWEDERGRDAAQHDIERMRQEDRLGRLLSQLEHMRAAFDAERRTTETQLQLLADELGFERRRSLAQLVVLVSVIVLGALSRGEAIDALLRPLSADSIRRRARDSVPPSGPVQRAEGRQKRLSTGPLAGMLIDVGPLPNRDRDPDQPVSPSTPRGSKRRPLGPSSSVRRRTPGTRSISAADAAALFDDEPGASPTRHMHAHHHARPGARGVAPNLTLRPRRLARSSHLHTMRRRDGSASEAERESEPGLGGEGFGQAFAREAGLGRERGPVTPTFRARPPLDRLESHGASGGDEHDEASASASEVEDGLRASGRWSSGSEAEAEDDATNTIRLLRVHPHTTAHHVRIVIPEASSTEASPTFDSPVDMSSNKRSQGI